MDAKPKEWTPLIIGLMMSAGYGVVQLDALKERPLTALILFPGWILASVVVAGSQDIANQLRERLVPRCVDWIVARSNEFFNQARSNYLVWLRHKYGDFDVKGLSIQGPFSLDLSSTFVPLRLRSQPAHEVSPNPIPPHSEVTAEGQELWHFLSTGENYAVIGAPGSGKTTLLRHVVISMADPRIHAPKKPQRVPVIVYLRDVAESVAERPAVRIEEIVSSTLSNAPKGAPTWVAAALSRGECVVLLDGLDEVADPKTRTTIAHWIESEVTRLPNNQYIVSSRPFGYRSNPIAGFDIIEVLPFRRVEIEDFVQKWYHANEVRASGRDDDGVIMRSSEGAEDLLQRLDRAPDLLRLAVNPLLLTLIANVHRFRSSLPGRRVELYNEICDVFLGRRQEARGIALDLTPWQKRAVLQPLAWAMMERRVRELRLDEIEQLIREPLRRVKDIVEPAAFLKQLEQSSGLVVERELGIWGFSHKTFQEYLASAHAREHHLEQHLAGGVHDQWWHETILLYVAQGDATAVVERCLEQPEVGMLVLALQCVEEAREVRPDLRGRLLSMIDEALESDDVLRRRLAADCRLELRLRNLIRVDEGVFVDGQLLTCAEYQLFIDEEAAVGRRREPDHWSGRRFAPGAGATPILGLRGTDALAFCKWLTARDLGEWTYRIPRADEADDLISQRLPQDAGFWHIAKDGSLSCSEPEADGFTPTALQFEEALDRDLARAATYLGSKDEILLGEVGGRLEIDAEKVKHLQALQKWAKTGDLRLGLRVARRAIHRVSESKVWTFVCFVGPGVGRALLFALRTAAYVARPFLPLLRLVPWSSAAKRGANGVAQAVTYGVRGGVYIVKPLVTPLWKALMRRERKLLEAEEPAEDLSNIIGEDTSDNSRAAVDVVMMILVTTLYEFLDSNPTALAVHGQQLERLCQVDDCPEWLKNLLESLSSRAWHGAVDADAVADTLGWAVRIGLLLWLRDRVTLPGLRTVKTEAGRKSDELTAGVRCWLDAWTISERAEGVRSPFEGLILVRERKFDR